MIWNRWWSPWAGALLLSLLFVAHLFCAAWAVDAASAPPRDGTAVGAGSEPAGLSSAADHADRTDSTDEEHHLCPSDVSTGADQRGSGLAGAVLTGLGTGTALLRTPVARAVPWRPSATAAVPWSGTRLLISLCVQRV
ncbi:hypothetical protein ADL05_12420 [Nocardiopsis sp. NRRL B-16309]|nr:hypothetical protein ADL05_12420 [Nocardiopsis sp. NRRL B-16309]